MSNNTYVGYNDPVGSTVNQWGGSATTQKLYIGGSDGTSGTGTYNLYNGTLQVYNNTYVGYSDPSVQGSTFSQYGGANATQNLFLGGSDNGTSGTGTYTLVYGSVMVYNNTYVGYNGTGAFNQGYDPSTGATGDGSSTVTIANNLYIGGGSSAGGTSPGAGTGNYNLNNGTLNVSGNTYVGYNDPSAAGSTFNQQGGSVATQNLYIGGSPDGTSGTGTYNLNNGALNVSGTTYVGYNGAGTFNQSGGTHAASNILVGTGGTYNYSGGTIKGAFTNNGHVNVTGGTTAQPNHFAASVVNNAIFNVKGANVVFDNSLTNNSGATFTINGSHVTFQGAFVNYGNLVSDPSTIIFGSTFTGGTIGTITASNGDTYEFLGSVTGPVIFNVGTAGVTLPELLLGNGVTLDLEVIGGGKLTINDLIDSSGSGLDITGDTTDLNVTSYGSSNPVPIPGALVLLGSGFAAFISARRRYRKK